MIGSLSQIPSHGWWWCNMFRELDMAWVVVWCHLNDLMLVWILLDILIEAKRGLILLYNILKEYCNYINWIVIRMQLYFTNWFFQIAAKQKILPCCSVMWKMSFDIYLLSQKECKKHERNNFSLMKYRISWFCCNENKGNTNKKVLLFLINV